MAVKKRESEARGQRLSERGMRDGDLRMGENEHWELKDIYQPLSLIRSYMPFLQVGTSYVVQKSKTNKWVLAKNAKKQPLRTLRYNLCGLCVKQKHCL